MTHCLLRHPPGSTHFTYIIEILLDILSVQFMNCDFVVLIWCCGRAIPPLCLFLKFLPSPKILGN